MPLPSQPRNQQVRNRGETLGEGDANWPMGFGVKPMLDETRTQGIVRDERGQEQPQTKPELSARARGIERRARKCQPSKKK